MKSKHVIITNGSGGSGKEHFVYFLQEQFSVYKYSAICKVKDIAALCGVQTDDYIHKDEKLRKFLSDLKLLTVSYNDMPMNDMKGIYDKFLSDTLDPSANDKYSGITSDYPSAQILIFDIREPEEIEKAKKEFDATTVLITRPTIDIITSNTSDANVNKFDYDYEIINKGPLNELRKRVYEFVDWLSTIEGR